MRTAKDTNTWKDILCTWTGFHQSPGHFLTVAGEDEDM
jgi:hypothetical protein